MVTYPEEMKGKFGFGFMRLPMHADQVDMEECTRMVDAFLEAGFSYFDTASVYLNGQSEAALKQCLTSRYPRERYCLTNKLSRSLFEKEEDIRPLVDRQLAACGVEYFDFYLMHALSARSFQQYKQCRAIETAFQLKAEGKLHHVGMSFHDTAQVLDEILTEYPQLEVVQLQFNYLDYEDAAIQSRLCYEVCQKHHKPVIVMEPVKGGKLIELPDAAKQVFDELQGGSYASYAIRYAASFEDVAMVLSGMGSMAMVEDNCGYMASFQPLDEREQAAVRQVCAILRGQNTVACTGCRYCVDGCPRQIPIPELFACLNGKRLRGTWDADYYARICTESGGRAGDCIECGLCEGSCPQHLPIRELLKEVRQTFEG